MPWFDKHGKLRARLSAMVDGELSGRDLTELSSHLETCDACTRELDELVATSTAVRALPDAAPHRSFTLTPEMAAAPAKPAPPAPMPRLQVGMRLASAAIALALVVVFVADNSFSGNSNDSNRNGGDDSALTIAAAPEADSIVGDIAASEDPAYSTIGETPSDPSLEPGSEQGANDSEAAPTTTVTPDIGGGSSTGGGTGGGSGGIGGFGGGTVPEVTAAPPEVGPSVVATPVAIEDQPLVTPLASEQRASDVPTQTEEPLTAEVADGDDGSADSGEDARPDQSEGGGDDVNIALIAELVLLAALIGTVAASIFLAVRRRQS